MQIGHFIHYLHPFGIERVVETLLKYRAPTFQEQFVVSTTDGPMRRVYEQLGCKVWIIREEREIVQRLKQADLVNLHVGSPEALPLSLAGRFSKPKIVTIHWPSVFPARMADRFIATSAETRRMQPDPNLCSLIPNGIDLARYPGERSLTPGRRVISRICRPEKCDEFFWYALLPILTEYPDTQLWLTGTEGASSVRVRILGIRSNVAEVLAHTDLFVYTPRPDEGTKDMVVMEAMAMGVPCVFSDVPTIRESIGERDIAHLIPFNQADALANAIRGLLDDVGGARQLGERARKYALQNFDVRPRVAAYEKVYQEVA